MVIAAVAFCWGCSIHICFLCKRWVASCKNLVIQLFSTFRPNIFPWIRFIWFPSGYEINMHWYWFKNHTSTNNITTWHGWIKLYFVLAMYAYIKIINKILPGFQNNFTYKNNVQNMRIKITFNIKYIFINLTTYLILLSDAYN